MMELDIPTLVQAGPASRGLLGAAAFMQQLARPSVAFSRHFHSISTTRLMVSDDAQKR